MDAFYASVELLRHPELRGQPVVVGGSAERGVVAAASYEARSFGIHSAMPSVRAKRLCPHAVFLSGDHAHYAEVSGRLMEILRSYTPLVEPLSLDEAFLDVDGARRVYGEPPRIARLIRRQIYEQEGLTCSVGVASIKFLAKLATDQAKPKASPAGPVFGSGISVVAPGGELEYLHPLPVRSLWGVGPKTLAKLERLGVLTIGDLARLPQATVISALGEGQGRHLWLLANAIDEREVEPDQAPKSISHEETFATDRHDRAGLDVELVRMADAVSSRLRRHQLAGRTVQLKVRFHDFHTITRSVSAREPVDTGPAILRAARQLFDQIDPAPGVRLLGVGVSGLVDGAVRQLSLDDLMEQDWTQATSTIDDIRSRFGEAAIGPASLAASGELKLRRLGDQQWGPDRPSTPAEPIDGE